MSENFKLTLAVQTTHTHKPISAMPGQKQDKHTPKKN